MNLLPPSREKSAFSLVELLVVIAIIGILVALLLTSLSQAKAKAQRTQCANNLKQLGVALHGFVIEHGTYPLFINPNRANGQYPEHQQSWMAALRRADLPALQMQCPAASRPRDLPATMMYIGYGYNARGLSSESDTNSLGLGGHTVWDGGNPTQFIASPVREPEVTSPSETLAIGDGFYGRNGILHDQGVQFARNLKVSDYLGSTKRAYARHRGKANAVFCDGHVESPSLKFLFEDASDAALAHWNRDHQPHREKLAP